MPKDFTLMEDGDELTIDHINVIYQELMRWRKMTGSGAIHVDHADGEDPPTIIDSRMKQLRLAQLTSGITAGSLASPTSAAGKLLVPISNATGSGYTATGGKSITIYNLNATAITGTKTCWVVLQNSTYYLAIADC